MEKDTIIAVLVLYKTKFSMAKTVQTLSKSMAIVGWTRLDIVVYDNSPEYNTSFIDNEKDNIYFAIHYIADYSNSGVSKAYNITARLGRTLNKKYLLLLDQDTEIALSFCKTISMIRGSYPLIFPILVNDGVIISPCKYQFGRGSSLSANECTEGLKRINNKNFLNSGAIISIPLFEKIGGFDESLPLYFSDFNFFNRMRKIVNSYYQMDVCCYHEMSSNDDSNIEQFIRRFELYCDGALKCYKDVPNEFLMASNILLRAIKVGIKHKTLRFTIIAMQKIYEIFFK